VRVLIVADVIGGVRTFTAELARQLAADGDEVHLALIGPPAAWAPVPGVATCEVADLRLEWMEDPWDDVAATAEWVEGLIERVRPDVVHMNTFAPVGGEVPVVLTAHSCVLSWWRAVHGVEAPPSWERYRHLRRAALARADLVVAPTAAMLRELPPLGQPALVIPGARRVAPAVPGERERLVVTVGRLWDAAKNVAAVAAVASRMPARVVAIGAGGADGLEATGELDEAGVLGWLRRAAVFAEPARYEPFGLSALEAALCGCALVLGDIPSLREVWGEAAAFVPPDDPDALVAAVGRLLRDPRRRRVAVSAAATRASRYTPRLVAGAYRSAYTAALDSRVPA
jgi:glycogen synthase